MAARKKAAKASKATKSKPISKPSSVFKKNTSAKISKPPTRRSSRIFLKNKGHEVRLLGNGLFDMSETPPWLVHVYVTANVLLPKVFMTNHDSAERNAKQSPLLRLPGEIRNRIYHYAMIGNVAMVTEDNDRAIVNEKTGKIAKRFHKVRAVGVKDGHGLSKWLDTARGGNSTFESNFHLLEVCRQIYTETATLAYSGTNFYLEAAVSALKRFGGWSSTLLPAQRNAITDIAMEELTFALCLTSDSHPTFRDIFSGIKRLHVCRHHIDYLRLVYTIYCRKIIAYGDVVEEFEEWIPKILLQIVNADVEIIFHPKQPAGAS